MVEAAKEKAYGKIYNDLLADSNISADMKKILMLNREKGAGAWLTALPIQSLGYALNKEDFRGSLCLRYGWRIPNMPMYCACGKKNSIDHSLSCPVGGYSIYRHDRVRDTIANILRL